LKAGDKLLILKTDGVVVLAAANVNRYERVARARIADTTTRAVPALPAGRLSVRDSRMPQCLDVGQRLESQGKGGFKLTLSNPARRAGRGRRAP
jgi:hypothetical protein